MRKFLTSALDGSCQLHVPAAIPSGLDSSTHWIGDWAGLRDGLDAVAKKIPAPARSRTSVFQHVA